MSQSHQQARDMLEQQQKGHNQIVRIQSDTETNLDELFKAVIGPKGNNPLQTSVPMRLRNLPPSFFQQPERGSKSASHSRESSADNTNYTSPPPHPQKVSSPQQQTASSPQHTSGLQINHPRAHSSPASLQQTYSNNTAQHQHLRQQSYDITDDHDPPLPLGWEKAKTASGQLYFLNHLTQTTTWEDPRKKLSAGSLSSSSSTGPASPVFSLQSLGSLPEYWEEAKTAEGEIYFINHKTRTTSWYDPRIPIHLQQPPLVPVSSAHGVSIQQVLQPPQLSGQLSQASSLASNNSSIPSALTLQQHQQKLRLQRLQKERERLRIRQQEILRQSSSFGNNPLLNEMMMRHTLREEPTSPSNSEIQPTSHTNIDPFLSGSDYHSRQESADSGLGLGNNFSLPNTPEDYLISMDEGGESNSDLASELNLESLQGSNLDLVTENMDSDDLVPSLQEELNADILSDVEALLNSNKDSVMKWL